MKTDAFYPMLTLFLLLVFLPLTTQGQKKALGTLQQQDFLEEVQFEWRRDKIFIPVQIGDETYQFILDTGGSLSISERIQDKFNFEQVAVAQVIGINKLSKRVPYVKVSKVRLGNLEFKNYNATVSDYARYPYDCMQADGIIGRDFLKGLILKLDLEQQLMTLSDTPALLPAPKLEGIPLKIDRKTSLPYIKVDVQPFGKQWVVFDSGSDDLFSFKTKTINKYREQEKFEDHPLLTFFGVTSLGSSGVIPKPMAAYTTFVEKLTIGQTTLNKFYADISKRSRSRVGTGLLRYGSVMVDYQAKQFYFIPTSNHQEATGMKGSIGFFPRYTENGYIVSALQPQSKAEKEGLQLGDRILQLNEINLRNMEEVDHCELYLNGYGWENRKESRVTFLKDGKEKMIVIPQIVF